MTDYWCQCKIYIVITRAHPQDYMHMYFLVQEVGMGIANVLIAVCIHVFPFRVIWHTIVK